ncbi:MAG TPA: glycosyl hydrolase family 18 protein [Gaiellaceae bacterium]|nr:glycosyl hydrolase family 18 protein [Gaiellaceae bacterium]
MRVRVGLVVLLFALAGAAGSSATTPLAVLGFQSDYSPVRLIGDNAKAMSLVGIDGVDLSGPGTVSAPTAADRRQLAAAHAHGLPAVLLVSNWSDRVNDFYEPLAHETLGSPQKTDEAASALAGYIVHGGWDGVSVDLESLAPRDTADLTRFVSDLKADLPGGDSLTICLSAATTLDAYASMGYDLPALAASVDQIVLMTYDDHGPWEKTPGPIGPLRWQRASVAALKKDVPADKIFLGVANYAYAWRPHSVDSLTVAQARRLAARWHAQRRWIASAGEWRAKLTDGSTVWWSDKRSMSVRLALARTLGVYGIAVWSLGTGDRLP